MVIGRDAVIDRDRVEAGIESGVGKKKRKENTNSKINQRRVI
jgi:hypothetical protein